jgi:hypothetical protein
MASARVIRQPEADWPCLAVCMRAATCGHYLTQSTKSDLSGDIARTERALQDALNDLRILVSLGQRDAESRALIQRCQELSTLLEGACARLPMGDDEDATRAAAGHLAAHLVILEREVDQAPLH